MSLLTNKGKAIKDDMNIEVNPVRGEELSKALITHFDQYHSLNEVYDKELERELLDDELQNLNNPKRLNFRRGLVTFSPSSADKCDRELYYKAKKFPKEEGTFYPYQRRWVNNGSAVHARVQKDLLFAEKHLDDPLFNLVRMKAPESVAGRPAWEHNLKNVKQFPELGLQIFGMMDGVLEYTKDGSKVGFEFKTKSTTIASIGNYKLKQPQSSHLAQVTAYSLLFGLDEFLIMYESIAKDWWGKGEEARPDIRAFYHYVSDEDKNALLNKFVRVAKMVKANELPEAEFPKTREEYERNFACIFCPYKEQCQKDGGYCAEQLTQWDEEKEKEREEAKRKRKEAKNKGAK